ncbi:MAG: hypothetical protein M0Z69_12725 [Actinomycetota bacterium]|nr:hypothetical protein [Actinomycetota bacterium]
MSLQARRSRESRAGAGFGWTALPMVVTALVLAACGGGSAASTTTSATAPSSTAATTSPRRVGGFSLVFYDEVTNVACLHGSPAGAMCFLLSGHGVAAGFGGVTVGPARDVEVPVTSSLCGRPESFLEHVAFDRGEVTVRVKRPRLCIGATGLVGGTFVVIDGGGALAGARGRGTVTIDVLASGAEETWKGSITAGRSTSRPST